MEIHSEKSENNSGASCAKEVAGMLCEGFCCLVKISMEILESVRTEFKPLVNSFITSIKGDAENDNIKVSSYGKEVDSLDMKTLVDFSKQHFVEGSNEIVAIKVEQPIGCFIYLAYSKDKELLPADKNNYLIIKAKSLTSEVKELFAESEIIILK